MPNAILFIFVSFFLIFSVGNVYALYVKPEKPVGILGEPLEISVLADEHPFETCSFTRGINITLDDSHNTTDNFIYWQDDEKTTCKLIIKSMKADWKGLWNVTIAYRNIDKQLASFSLGMTEPRAVETNLNFTIEVGSVFNHDCDSDQKYARVFDPQGVLISEGVNAAITLPFVRIKDAGVWLCFVQMADRLEELKISITLNVTSSIPVQTFVEETDTEVRLLCRHLDTITSIPCLFQTPVGSIFAPHEGVPSERYAFYGNDTRYDCGMTIKKPLLISEKGIWKCMMTAPKYASLLSIGDGTVTKYGSTKTPNITIILSDSYNSKLTVQCSYPEALSYCYARSPAGRIYSAILGGNVQVATYTGMGLNQGDCQITIDGDHLWKNESGRWLCGMGVEGFDDVQVKINVLISDQHFQAEINKQNVDTGDRVILMCRSVLGYGLRYCRFNHPTGKSLNLGFHSMSIKNRFTYMGKGLDAGDCGLIIEDFQAEDFGTWTCATAFVGNNWLTEFQDAIILSKAPMSFSAIVGISAALGVVGIVGAGGLVFWQLRRKRRGTPLLEAVTMHNSNNSGFHDSESDLSGSHNS